MSKHTFKVKLRDKSKKNKQLRRKNIIPANIFGAGEESQAIQCKASDFAKLYREIGNTGLVYLKSEDLKKEVPALIDEIQYEPISDDVLHVAFKKVNLKEKIVSEVPIEFTGIVEIPETVVVHVRDSVEVEALPTDLPEKLVVDVSVLSEIGQSITLADLEFDKDKVTLVIGEEGEDAPVVLLQEVKEEVIEEPEVELEGEEALEGEGEGEVAAGEEEGEAQAGEKTEGAEKAEQKDKQDKTE